MIRISALFAALFLSFAQPTTAQTFRQGDTSLIPHAENALRVIRTMTASFTFQNVAQFNTGRLFIDRLGGRMRMEFDPPLRHLIIANGARTDFIGGVGTVVNTATQSTPLALIFGARPKLSGEVQVLEIATKDNAAFFAVTQRSRPKAGKVILHFIKT